MKLDQPASERRALFGEGDAVLQSHPLLESARHPDAAVPRFGDTISWDFNGIVRRPANLSPAEWRIQFSSSLEEPLWNLLARELLTAMANPHHEMLQEAGVYLGTAPAKIPTLIQTASKLRSLLAWSKTAGLPPDPSHWNTADLRRRVKGLRSTQKPGTVVAHVILIKRLAAVAPALTCDWPSEDPWPGRSARQVAHYVGQRELATKAIPPEIWFPLIRAAWAYVRTFAPDILRAVGRRDELLAAASPSIMGRHAEVEAWLANTANKIPVHAAPQEDGQPRVNWLLLDLFVGLRSQPTYTLVKSSRYKPRVLRAVAEGRTTTQGLVDGLAQVSRPDGTVGPWHPGIGPQHLFNLTVALRNAAFVLVAGLSMMRDSEKRAELR